MCVCLISEHWVGIFCVYSLVVLGGKGALIHTHARSIPSATGVDFGISQNTNNNFRFSRHEKRDPTALSKHLTRGIYLHVRWFEVDEFSMVIGGEGVPVFSEESNKPIKHQTLPPLPFVLSRSSLHMAKTHRRGAGKDAGKDARSPRNIKY